MFLRKDFSGVNRMFCSVYKYCCASIAFPTGNLSLPYCSDVLLLLSAKKTSSYISSTTALTVKPAVVQIYAQRKVFLCLFVCFALLRFRASGKSNNLLNFYLFPLLQCFSCTFSLQVGLLSSKSVFFFTCHASMSNSQKESSYS